MSECCCWVHVVVQLCRIMFFFLKLWKTVNIMEITTENDSFIYLFTWKVRYESRELGTAVLYQVRDQLLYSN